MSLINIRVNANVVPNLILYRSQAKVRRVAFHSPILQTINFHSAKWLKRDLKHEGVFQSNHSKGPHLLPQLNFNWPPSQFHKLSSASAVQQQAEHPAQGGY